MDSVTEESPLAPVLLLWDYAERLLDAPLHESEVLRLIIWVVTHVVLFGPGPDIFAALGIWCYLNRSQVISFAIDYRWLKVTILFTATLAATRLIASFFSARSGRDHGLRPGSAKPYLVPCRTTHSRFFPEKHSFSYSYLLVGTPVGVAANFNGMISTDVGQASRGWYDIDASDFLGRGSGHLGLRGKLDNYLISQGVEPSSYPHAYLLTAARFLGYHFNPVSFWYLYSKDRILSAIVLEVNNTFGERRPYLVLRDFESEAKHLPSNANDESLSKDAPRVRIKNSWKKDFHVSPFNSRKGEYSLMASDPLGGDMDGFRGVDITINLSSSKGHPKLVARLFSEGSAIEPLSMTAFEKINFLSMWFWVGLVTFPRIARQAFALFFKRGLHVWYRPEPLKDSLGRDADSTEKQLEDAFRHYLQYLVEHAKEPLIVEYTPCGIPNGTKEIFTSSTTLNDAGSDLGVVQIKVLTPSFYSRFVGYAHDFEAIFCELAESCTLWIDKPDMLPKIFLKKPSPPLHVSSTRDFLLFKAIQALRRRPDVIRRPLTSAEAAQPSPQALDIRAFRNSSMDAFILGQGDSKLKKTYQAALIQLFIAEGYFFGYVEVVRLLLLACRLGISASVAVFPTRIFETLLSA